MKDFSEKFLAILVSTFLFCACQEQVKHYRIGVSQCSEDLWRETVNSEILREADLYENIDVEIRSVRDDSDAQIQDIEYFIREKVDVLIVSPNESAELTPVITKAYQSGIPVILLDRKIDNDQYPASVGADNRQIGYEAGEYINALLKGEGEVVLVRGTKGSTADSERYEGFINALYDLRSNLHIKKEFHGNFLFLDAKESFLDYIAENGYNKPADLVFAFNDQMAYGVSDAFAAVNESRTDKIQRPYIIGVDALSGSGGGIEYLSKGYIDATFIYPTGGDTVIELAQCILSGEPFEKENILKSTVVDASNLRLFDLQGKRILEQQKKVEELNSKVSMGLIRYTRQRYLLDITIFFIVVFVLLVILLYKSNSSKNKLNRKLQEQNDSIQKHVEILQLQKNQLVELSRKLEETTQAKLVFYTNISHEFKTPLSLIIGPVEDLMSRKDLDDDARKTLEIVHRSTSKLERLITELLDFRTYENGKMVINYSMGNLKQFISNINSLFEDVIRRRNIQFEFNTRGEDFYLPFDAKKMEKLYTNLMSNAFNHLDKGGGGNIRVFLGITEDRHCKEIELRVFNSGSYVPVSEREKIFHRFYSMDKDQKGTGIGLSLVSSIVDAFGGEISVESEKESGTEFVVFIPVENDITTDASVDSSYVPDFAKQKLATMSSDDFYIDIVDEMCSDGKPVILVIEDNVDMLYYIKSVLSKDYHVLLADNGELGLKKAEKFSPALIISDIMMPGMDGFEVCRTLKEKQKTENIPVILLTACSLEEQKAQGYEEGADVFVQKPFNVRTLKSIMKGLLEKGSKLKAATKSDWLLGSSVKASEKSSGQLLDSIRNYVEDHIHEEISIEAMAQHLGFSKSKLYRELSEITEYSPIDIVNLIKLKKAVNLMLYDGFNISEAAFRSGFSSPSYFSRAFLKYYHERPKDYIAKHSRN